MLFGGRNSLNDSAPQVGSEFWLFDLSIRQWTQQASGPPGRFGAVLSYGVGSVTNMCDIWSGCDGVKRTVRTVTDDLRKRNAVVDIDAGSETHHQAARFSRVGYYLFGGFDDTMTLLRDLWFWNSETATWIFVATIDSVPSTQWPQARALFASWAVESSLYVTLGNIADNSLWTFDGTSLTWTQTTFAYNAVAPQPRYDAAFVYVQETGQLFVFGGADATTLQPLPEVWYYTAATHSWTLNLCFPGYEWQWASCVLQSPPPCVKTAQPTLQCADDCNTLTSASAMAAWVDSVRSNMAAGNSQDAVLPCQSCLTFSKK